MLRTKKDQKLEGKDPLLTLVDGEKYDELKLNQEEGILTVTSEAEEGDYELEAVYESEDRDKVSVIYEIKLIRVD